MGRSLSSVISEMAENSPGRSDPRIGGAKTGVCVRECFCRFGFGLREIVMVTGVGGVRGCSEGAVCTRKSVRDVCRMSEGRLVGRVVCETSGKVRERWCHCGATISVGWSLVLVREQRRDRKCLREVERRRHCRYLTALCRLGCGSGRPRRCRRRRISGRVMSLGGLPRGW